MTSPPAVTGIRPSIPQTTIDRTVLSMARRVGGNTMHIGAVLTFPGPAPSLEELAAHVAERLPLVPELTYRAAGATRHPAWEPDRAFDLGRHLHRIDVDATAVTATDAMVTAMHTPQLDPERPLWGLWLLSTPDGWGLGYRSHHAFQDGLAGMRALRALFGPPTTMVRQCLTPPPARSGSDLGLGADMLPLLRPVGRWSPLDGPLDGRRVAHTVDTGLDRLRAISRSTGASLNQICLAALASVLRDWHPEDWTGPDRSLRTGMGVSLRHPGAPLLGNWAGVTYLDLPCGDATPLDRLEKLRGQLTPARLRQVRHRQALLYQRLPYWCAQLGVHLTLNPRHVPLCVSDVPFPVPLTFNGVTAEGVYPLMVWPPRQPLFAAWSSYRDRMCVAFHTYDTLAGHDTLTALWTRAVDDLEQACESVPYEAAAHGERTRG
ncbi:wax ester/triacylglycerol synthase domain-containing protein [Streptomyces longispororuber]|uniref:wax ester/triacylglycerol synthase domain-containing protein n=1 Tax=Streptomyces longispororuber TaxID=68230 RepID=UPI00210C0EE8|nr:wax ester/triacylglycerol synthase domain-containing protein [Streptomyces longispororuber]MCQ4210577.1 WS/DGAT domain-containing protein [Streptomyces longispororuber]